MGPDLNKTEGVSAGPHQEWDECRNSWDHQSGHWLEGPSSCCKREEHSPTQLLGPPPAFIQKDTAGMWLWIQEGSEAPQFLPVPTEGLAKLPSPADTLLGCTLPRWGPIPAVLPPPCL